MINLFFLAVFSLSLVVAFPHQGLAGVSDKTHDDFDVEKYERLADEARQDFQRLERVSQEATRIADGANLKVDRLRNRLGDAQRKADDAVDRDKALRNDLQRNNRERPMFERQLQEAERDLPGLEQTLQRLNQEVASLRSSWEPAKKKLEAEESELRRANEDANQKEKEANSKQAIVDQLERDIQNADTKKAEMVARLGRLKDQAKEADQEADSKEIDLGLKKETAGNKKKEHDEVKTNRSKLLDEVRELARKIREAEGDQERVAALKKEREAKQAELNSSTSEMEALSQKVRELESAVSSLEREIPALKQKAQSLLRDANELTQAIARFDSDLEAKKNALPGAKSAAQHAVSESRQAKERAQKQIEEVRQAKEAFAQVDGNFQRAKIAQEAVEKEHGAKVRQRDQSRKSIAEIDRENGRIQREIDELLGDLRKLRNDIRDLKQELDVSAEEALRAERRLSEINRELANADQNFRRMDGALGRVEQNIVDAQAELGAIGRRDGESDGSREGAEIGQANGRETGRAEGVRDGQIEGSNEGRQIWYDEGFEAGKEEGTQAGRNKALKDAETNGLKIGASEGKQAGLETAFQTGVAQGKAAANDTASYNKGLTEGTAAGLQRAQQETKPLENKGFSEKEKEFLSVPLKAVELAAPLAAKFKGLQGKVEGPGDGRYYNPRPAQYPHPRLRRFYMEAYDARYREVLAREYEESRKESYEAAYQPAFEQARKTAVSKSYPADKEKGFEEARERFEKETYESVYPTEYKQRRQRAYDTAFNAAAKNQSELERGNVEGNREASYAKGLEKGQTDGYASNLAREKQEAYQRGVQNAQQKYQGAVLQVVSATLSDADGDGFVVPGEELGVELKVKNFGLQGKSGLAATAELKTGQSVQIEVPALPAQSFATVKGLARIKSAAGLKLGTALDLSFLLTDGPQTLAKQTFPIQVNFPVKANLQGDVTVLDVGIKKVLKVTLVNQSQAAKAVVVDLDLDGQKAQASARSQSVTVPARASAVAEFTLVGQPSALFEAVELKIGVQQNSLAQAATEKVRAVVGSRHKTTAEAAVLLAGADLSLSEAKAFFGKVKSDTFDSRIDGALSAALLQQYASKAVVLNADKAQSALTAGDIAALNQYLAAGGALFIIGDPSDLPQGLAALASVRKVKNTVVRAAAGGHFLAGGSYQVDGPGAVLDPVGNAVGILADSGEVVGVMRLVNEFSDKPGRVFTLAFAIDQTQAGVLTNLLNSTATVRSSFGEKAQAAQKDFKKMGYVILDVKDELVAEDAAANVQWFKTNRKKSKLYRALDGFLKGDGSDKAKAFAEAYPSVLAAAHAMSDAKDKAVALDVIETTKNGVFGSNWKGYYCKYFKKTDTHKLCP